MPAEECNFTLIVMKFLLMLKERCTTRIQKIIGYGDIIGVKGEVFKTKVGEESVHVKELT